MVRFNIIQAPDQKFSAIINGRRITIRLRLNPSIDRWHFDLALDGDYVLHGRRLITNTDLLAPYGFDVGVIFAHSFSNAAPNKESLYDGAVGIFHANEDELNAVLTQA